MDALDLMRRYLHVADMCKGTLLENEPWKCVKWERKGNATTIYNRHPDFSEYNPIGYKFAVAILEDKPVFVGDTVYIYRKDGGAEYKVTDIPSNIKAFTWSKPFILGGVELPRPVEYDDVNHNMLQVIGVNLNAYRFKSESDLRLVEDAINRMNWLPIESAPKDRRILLFYPKSIFTGVNVACGQWLDSVLSKYSKPYWTNDLEALQGPRATSRNQPTHWMELPGGIDYESHN